MLHIKKAEVIGLVSLGLVLVALSNFSPSILTRESQSLLAQSASGSAIKWQPGHYMRLTDDNIRGYDGSDLLDKWLKKDVKNFKGIYFQINWGDVEKSKGNYDWSEIDVVAKKLQANNKFFMLKIMERTFHGGCNSKFAPSYVKTEKSTKHDRVCFVPFWESKTNDQFITFLKKVGERYNGHPAFLGFIQQESAVGITFSGHPTATREKLENALKKQAVEIHKVAPNVLVAQGLNWPQDKSLFTRYAQHMVGLLGGGALTWPDSIPRNANSWLHYQVAREFKNKIAIVPSAQTPFITCNDTDAVFKMLVDDIGAHYIGWDSWNGGCSNYFDNRVIPTVNKFNGRINTSCPSSFGSCIRNGGTPPSSPPPPSTPPQAPQNQPPSSPSPLPSPPIGSFPEGQGLRGEYYDNPDFTNMKVSRIDPFIGFQWGLRSPDSSIGWDTFSIRWSGKVTPRYSENYTFHTFTDDGARLWVNGKLLVNDWEKQSTTENTGTIQLQAGRGYDIVFEYYEQNWAADAALMWSSASQKKEIVPPSRLKSLDVPIPPTPQPGQPPIASTPVPPATTNNQCSAIKWAPGHYIRVSDDQTRGLNGLPRFEQVLNKDLSNFAGVEYQTTWGGLERQKGVYDFSELDKVLSLVKSKNKKYLLKIQDRTFHTGCNSEFIPNYAKRTGPRDSGNQNFCAANVWEKETMDGYIAIIKAIANRYKNEPSFIGFVFEETAVNIKKTGHPTYTDQKFVNELIRINKEIHDTAPNLMRIQGINWMTKSLHEQIAKAQAKTPGGGLGWPDTIPSRANSWHWYDTAREFRNSVIIAPSAETVFVEPNETDAIYKMLRDDIQAHIVIWSDWHSNGGNSYLDNHVIPTVNKYNGVLKNTTNPFEGECSDTPSPSPTPTPSPSPTTPPGGAPDNIRDISTGTKWYPGHYARIVLDGTQGSGSARAIVNFMETGYLGGNPNDNSERAEGNTNLRLGNVKGVLLEINWGDIETSQGSYNWGAIDQALNPQFTRIPGKDRTGNESRTGRRIVVKVMDRTLQSGCNSSFAPSYIAREAGSGITGRCYAKNWETGTMDRYIALLTAMASRYEDDENFVGIMIPQTAVSPQANGSYTLERHEDELKRLYNAVRISAPTLLVIQNIDWPQNKDFFESLIQRLELIRGGGFGWPQTIPSNQFDLLQYEVARERNTRLAITPSVQTSFIGLNETDDIFNLLVDDIGAHYIFWNTTHPETGAGYFPTNVLPVINQFSGKINTACPGTFASCITVSGTIPPDNEVPDDDVLDAPRGLSGVYYNNLDFTDLALTRVDQFIGFQWGLGSPDPSIGRDTFSVRWTGLVIPRFSEEYTFHTFTDDGARLIVDGKELVNDWEKQRTTENTGTIRLEAGRAYAIVFDYYEQNWAADAVLMWSSSSQNREVVPPSQLRARTSVPGSGVDPPPPPVSNTPTCILTFVPQTVISGNRVTLSWTSTNATSGNISPLVGNVPSTGSVSGRARTGRDSTLTFSGTFNGPGGTAACETTVELKAK